MLRHDEILAAFLLALAGRRGQELFFSESKRLCIEIDPNRAVRSKMHTAVGVAGRTYTGRTLSFAYQDGYCRDALDDLLEQCCRVVGTEQTSDPFAMESQGTELVEVCDLEDGQVQEVANSLFEEGKKAALDIRRVYFQGQVDSYCLANNYGLRGNGYSALYSWGFEYSSSRDNDSFAYYTLHPRNTFDLHTMITEAKTAAIMADAPTLVFRDVPVVFTRSATAVLLFSLMSLMTSEALWKKHTFLRGLKEPIIVSEKVTVIENSRQNLYHRGGVDGEGSPKKEITIIERGIVRTVLSDLLTGQSVGLESTGSSYRHSFRDMPRVRGTKIAMSAGDDTEGQLLSKYPDLAVISNLMGLAACLDPTSSRFQVAADAYLYRLGHIQGKSRILINSSLIDIFRNVIDIGSERGYGADGSLYVPSIVVYPISIMCI
ncbi:MAG: PmbA protein [Bacillota bacterium]|nr:MAG: PmbA protein [Bacillota bacterium]